MFGFVKRVKRVSAAALSIGVILAVGTAAQAQDRVRWKVQSAFPSSLAILGEGAVHFTENTAKMSGGSLQFKLHEPGALVPALQTFDAVSIGSVDAAYDSAGYHVGKIPALSFFSTVPFGPRVGEYLAWIEYGGGQEIWDEMYAGHGLRGIPCAVLPPEGAGWFRKELASLDDLKGLKMRFAYLGAKVMEKLGVSTQLLAGGDIYPALELGTIDATEFSIPSIDLDLGFHQVAKHYYFPGWHQQASLGEFLVNKEKFAGLAPEQQEAIELACGENLNWTFVRSEGTQFAAMRELKEKGVEIHRFPDEFLAAFEKAWQEVAAEESAKDPQFKRAYDSYSKFRADYAIWRDHGYLD